MDPFWLKARGLAGPGQMKFPQPKHPGPSSSGTARGSPPIRGSGTDVPGPPSCPETPDDAPGGVLRASG